MATANVFNGDLFSEISLTKTIETAPVVPLGLAKYFDESGSPTKEVYVDRQQHKSNLLSVYPRGGTVGNQMPQPTRDAIILPIPHIPVYDEMLYDSWIGVRQFGDESAMVGPETELSKKSLRMGQAIETTLETMRLGALKGLVLDGSGATVLDINSRFGVSRSSFAVDLNGPKSIKLQLMQMRNSMELKLGGGYPIQDVVLLVGFNAFSFLAEHAEITDAFDGHANNREFFRANQALGAGEFRYADVLIKLYNWSDKVGSSTTIDDTGSTAADMEGLAFPVVAGGSLFQTVYGPGDTAQSYNVMGRKFFMNRQNIDWDLGVKLRAQSNPLLYCTRPDVPMTIDFTAGSTT